MLAVVVSGLLTGAAIAVPVGAVGAFLVTLASRTSLRVGAAGALGIATVDGAYAAIAVAAGAAVAAAVAPVADGLALASGLVLLGIAAITAAHALHAGRATDRTIDRTIDRTGRPAETRAMRPASAYALFVGVTAVNPTTVVYFAAVVIGNPHLVSTRAEGVVFVVAAFVASAAWQLLLAGGGAALGRLATGPRARVATGLVSAAVVAGLAVHTMLG